jgi:hypothetical protein
MDSLKMETNQDLHRMLNLHGILVSLCIPQTKIENEYFEKRQDFEKKESYLYQEIEIQLYQPERKEIKNEFKEKKRKVIDTNRNVISTSLFSDEPKPMDRIIPRREPRESREQREIRMYEPLCTMFDTIFRNKTNEYKMLVKNVRNSSSVFTFMNAVITGMNEIFYMKKEDEKMLLVKDLLKKMHAEVYLEGNYQKFYYHKQRAFKKETMQYTLNKALSLRVEPENFFIIQQYVCDYMGLNLFVFYVTREDYIDFEKSKYFLTKQFGGRMNPYVPTLCMILKNEVYQPIVHEKDANETILRYSKHKDELEMIWRYMNIYQDMMEIDRDNKMEIPEETQVEGEEGNVERRLYTKQELKSMKLEDLQNVAKENGIEIEKNSEKTGRKVKKLKNELMEDIIMYLGM